MENRAQELIEELAAYEKEESDLIALYRQLARQGVAGLLPREIRHEYLSGLDKLHADSVRHMKVMGQLINKYKNDSL